MGGAVALSRLVAASLEAEAATLVEEANGHDSNRSPPAPACGT